MRGWIWRICDDGGQTRGWEGSITANRIDPKPQDWTLLQPFFVLNFSSWTWFETCIQKLLCQLKFRAFKFLFPSGPLEIQTFNDRRHFQKEHVRDFRSGSLILWAIHNLPWGFIKLLRDKTKYLAHALKAQYQTLSYEARCSNYQNAWWHEAPKFRERPNHNCSTGCFLTLIRSSRVRKFLAMLASARTIRRLHCKKRPHHTRIKSSRLADSTVSSMCWFLAMRDRHKYSLRKFRFAPSKFRRLPNNTSCRGGIWSAWDMAGNGDHSTAQRYEQNLDGYGDPINGTAIEGVNANKN